MSESGFINDLHNKKKSPEEIFKRIAEVSTVVRNLPEESLPSLEYINNIGCSDAQHFKNSSINQFNELVRRFKVADDWKILDIGCGCGRMAFPFSEYLGQTGKYIGFDVWSDGIEWCNQNIRNDFLFKYIHAADNYYYEEKRNSEKNKFSLDFIENQTLDLIFAISVFTHLTKSDTQVYLKEISNVLKPGKFAYLTCFIIDDYFFEYQSRTGRFTEVVAEEPGCYYGYKKQDFFAGFTLDNIKNWVSAVGLELVFHELGTWAEKPGSKGFQDLLIIRKKLK